MATPNTPQECSHPAAPAEMSAAADTDGELEPYDHIKVDQLLRRLTPTHPLPPEITRRQVDPTAFVRQLIRASTVLRRNSDSAQLDAVMSHLFLLGHSGADVIAQLHEDPPLDPTGAITKSTQVHTAYSRLVRTLKATSAYSSNNVHGMLIDFVNGKPDAVPMPVTVAAEQPPAPVRQNPSRIPPVHPADKTDMERWLGKGLAVELSAGQLASLGKYLFGVTQTAKERRAVRPAVEALGRKLAQAEQTEIPQYASPEFRRVLKLEPVETSLLSTVIDHAINNDTPMLTAVMESSIDDRGAYGAELSRKRAAILSVTRRIMAIIS